MNEETSDTNDELRTEYDLNELLKGGVRGKYAARYQEGTNIVRLLPDVAAAFPTEEAVNQALRLVMRMAQLPTLSENQTVSSPDADTLSVSDES